MNKHGGHARCRGRIEEVDPTDRDLLSLALVLQVRGQHLVDHLLRELLGRGTRCHTRRAAQRACQQRGAHRAPRDDEETPVGAVADTARPGGPGSQRLSAPVKVVQSVHNRLVSVGVCHRVGAFRMAVPEGAGGVGVLTAAAGHRRRAGGCGRTPTGWGGVGGGISTESHEDSGVPPSRPCLTEAAVDTNTTPQPQPPPSE